jgi:multidrug efflux pump subunit AcrA (membrane-fusion protein)
MVIVAVALLGSTRSRNTVQAREIPSNGPTATVAFASPGRVEGASETTKVGAAADGILKAVYFREGQFVKKGTLLGEIACNDSQLSLQTALAEADGTCSIRQRTDHQVLRPGPNRRHRFKSLR